MKKIYIKRITVPVFCLFSIELLYFIFGVPTKNIFDGYLFQFCKETIQMLFTRFFLFLLSILTLNVLLSSKNKVDITDLFVDFPRKLIKIFVLRMIIDLCVLLPISSIQLFIIQTILNTLYLYLLFVIITGKHLSYSANKRFSQKQLLIAFILSIILFSYIWGYWLKYRYDLTQYNILLEKYVINIPDDFLFNVEFENDLLSSVYYWIVSVILYLMYSKQQNSDSRVSSNTYTAPVLIMRCFLCVLGITILVIFKSLCFPYGIISHISMNHSNVISYSDIKEFDVNHKQLKIYRVSYNNNDKCCYSKNIVEVMYGNDKIKEFEDYIVNTERNLKKINNELTIYNGQAIMYVVGGKPVVILAKQINYKEQDDYLTNALKEIIQKGNFEYLECSYEYLKKYSPDYLEKVLSDFFYGTLSNDFSDNIDIDYIRSFSKSHLSLDFKDSE